MCHVLAAVLSLIPFLTLITRFTTFYLLLLSLIIVNDKKKRKKNSCQHENKKKRCATPPVHIWSPTILLAKACTSLT